MTAKELLALKDGAKISIRKGDKVAEVVVKGRPELAPVGKPGIHRVRICVYDPSRMPKKVDDELWSAMVAFDRKAVYEVGGDKVVAILA